MTEVGRWWFRIHAADTDMAFPYDPDQAGQDFEALDDADAAANIEAFQQETLLTGNDRPGIELPPASDANGRRATQAELKTPLMPGRQADGAGSAVPDPRAESPDAARAGDQAR
jgi:hypothetical protein